MEKYNFNNAEEFSQLERLAYDGQLDFNGFPAAEYRYFDRIQDIGYKVRHENFPKEFARKDRDRALSEYREDIAELLRYREVAAKAMDVTIHKSAYINRIYKEHSPMKKLAAALELLEILIGEDGFAARNLSENYLEGETNDPK